MGLFFQMKLKIIPPLVFLMSLLLMLGVHYLTSDFAVILPHKVPISRGFFGLGAIVALMGILAFRQHGTTTNPARPEEASALVTGGVYRLTRNPMYLGMAIILIGGVIRTANPFTLIAVAAFAWYITMFQIRPEEEVLTRNFGEEYEKYRSKVRRWI